MAFAMCDQYGTPTVSIDRAGCIAISLGVISIHVPADEALRVRDEFSRAITEAATAAAKAVQAEGAEA